MLRVLCANERCSFILSCDGADQTSQEEGEEEKTRKAVKGREQSMHAGGSGHSQSTESLCACS